MELHIYLKGKTEPTIFKGDRIDVLDMELMGKQYKQVRYFRKGISKSQYISVDLINKIKTFEQNNNSVFKAIMSSYKLNIHPY